MARNTGRGSRAGRHNGRFTEAKRRGGSFKRRPEPRFPWQETVTYLFVVLLILGAVVWAVLI